MKTTARRKADSALAVCLLVVAAAACNVGGARDDGASSETNASKPAEKPPERPAEKSVDLGGSYAVEGTNPNGTAYRGSLEVVRHDQVYQFRWTVGSSQYDGVGLEHDGVVAVSFCSGSDGKGCGVVSYRTTEPGRLDGRWGLWGTDQSGTETGVRTSGPGDAIEGTYALEGTNPDGKQYKETLTVAKQGSGYSFAWTNGNRGYGVERAGRVTVGFGGAKCGFVAYEVLSDGGLDGIWGGSGSQATGTEKARKK